MKEATHGHDDHASPIKTPKQLIITVILAFIVPIVVIMLLVKFVAYAPLKGEGSQAMSNEGISQRIAPVAQLVLIDASAPKVLKQGEAVFKETCTSCHGAGIAGAPKVGDLAAWAPRIKEGAQTLFEHALKGFKGMPAKGGNADLDDVEVQRGVVYMANASGGKLKEPEAPAAATVASAGASAGPAEAPGGAAAGGAAAGAGSPSAAAAPASAAGTSNSVPSAQASGGEQRSVSDKTSGGAEKASLK